MLSRKILKEKRKMPSCDGANCGACSTECRVRGEG